MSITEYFAIGNGSTEPLERYPYPGYKPVACFNGKKFPGCMLMETGWMTEAFESDGGQLLRHKSDELYMFVGIDVENHESLNAEITFQIENDILSLDKTCTVFVPAGAAHRILKVKRVDKPFLIFKCYLNTDEYFSKPAEAIVETGTYASNVVYDYKTPSGKMPEAPPGFLQLLLYINGERVPNAPYMESVWFKTANDTGPAPHVHEFDEYIGFLGTDPARPDELDATIEFYIGKENIKFTKSTLVYIPRGVEHSPILVPELNRPIIHFSGGNGGTYVRVDALGRG